MRRIRRERGLDRLYLEEADDEATEIVLAAPGIDEPSVVTDLISALRALSGRTDPPVLAAFHVGITRIECDRFDGAALERTRSLLRELAERAVPDPVIGAGLSVIISSGLFTELQHERRLGEGWRPVPEVAAWLRRYQRMSTTENAEGTS